MPTTRIELFLSSEQIEWAKRTAEKWRKEDGNYTYGWRGVIEGVTLSAINDRISQENQETWNHH